MITRRKFNSIAIVSSMSGVFAAGSATAASSGDTGQSAPGSYDVQTVSFDSSGETLVGNLLAPASDGPHPAVVIIGPVAFVKEQSPVQYATRLASRGLAVLIFDPRYHGESSGAPRRYESGEAKVEDCQAALGFLAAQEGIDANRLHLLGICQGVNWAIETAVTDDRVASLGVVAGHYLTAETARMYLGSDAAIEARMERATKAAADFEETGEASYIPIVGSEDALLTATAIADWYLPWDNRAPWLTFKGGWENRITAMSEASIWGWRIDETAPQLSLPVLMIHGDRAASGQDIPRRIFEKIASEQKTLHWIDGANQLQFYEDPLTIDAAVTALAPHFLTFAQSS
ncbi:alpha/beta hydrolase [Ruegeria sp. 2205SS24-7]|uniref:alpha/beta hydrolase n=1 Tax=Ruegeria discodermiae TaxID=3064389 RepID=UPI0027418289|nr:alpha/beta hydrolase [Ruegeria sp. 2205SS24-7]MDP5219792.1 alpha/beta hydrolase [Ruegeria sp. 2205SS24-7]